MYEHLSLPRVIGGLERKKQGGGGGYSFPKDRQKREYYKEINDNAEKIAQSYEELKVKYSGKLNPHLIYQISVNQSVDYSSFEKILNSMGGITVLSVAENKQGYWVVFTNDTELASFRDKLAQYSGIKEGHKYDFFNAIDSIEDISIEEKIGPRLSLEPLSEEKAEYVDLELWRMDDEYLSTFIQELKDTYQDWSKFLIVDSLITKSFALYRVKISKDVLSEIIELKEVARVDRPFVPTFKLGDYYGQDIGDLEVLEPNDDSIGVLVIDSGIVSNHPLLEKAVGDEQNYQDVERDLQDKVGHGTAVAGVSIYGDIKQSLDNKKFVPSNWLFSAKVMYGEEDARGNVSPVYDEEKLFENQLNDAIRDFLDNDGYRIKVVNLSFGNSYEFLKEKNNRQYPLAALMDEIAYEYKEVVFVVSAGNADPRDLFGDIADLIENYPNYLVENDSFRIINPATSALSITVGSIAQEIHISEQSLDGHVSSIHSPIAKMGEPSPFTRSGFGINGMLKPEMVHYGGNLILKEEHGWITENVGGKLPVLSHNPTAGLFNFNYGTSFSAPMVTHLLGNIANKYPDKSANFLKNLLLQSTDSTLIEGFVGSDSKKQNSILKVQGYGVPKLQKAISSFDNRVLLLDEDEIGLNKVQVYSLEIPTTFFETKGNKRISVALTFDPITRMTRGDSYLGNRMQFKLYHTIDSDYVTQKFAEYDLSDDTAVVDELKGYEIKFNPGSNIRNSGCHQKGVKEFKRDPKMIPISPLTLVVVNSNKWIIDENHKQQYCVSVSIEHSQDIKLYTEIRANIQQRVRVR
jgi:subtilisin family serine protease